MAKIKKEAGMRAKSAFTLIELMVVIAIIGILGSVLSPNITTAIEKAQAAKIISAISTLTTACEMYRADTGQRAYEYSLPSYAASYYHRLSMDTGVSGWDGPYLKKPLSNVDNPGKATILLYSNNSYWHTSQGGSGFDLDQNGTPEVTGPGNSVVFYNVSESLAKRVDNVIDGGGTTNWQGRGQVEHRSNYYLTVLLTR